MTKPIHILYIPGLGDNYDPSRRRLLRLWRYKNITVELVPMRWASSESYSEKVGRIKAAMNQRQDSHVVLIGESAGGSVVVAMYEKYGDMISGALTICGKNRNAHTVSPRLYQSNPAFREAMSNADSRDRRPSARLAHKFVSVHPLYDPVVPVRETLLPGCQEITLWSVGHFIPIVQALTISSWQIIRAVRRLQSENM